MPTAELPVTLDSRQLRQLAEAAAGLATNARGTLVVDSGGTARLRPGDLEPGDTPLFGVTGLREDNAGAAVAKPPFAVQLLTGLHNDQDDACDGAPHKKVRRLRREGFDACFWSRAAVEKFVLPYYLPILGIEGIRRLRDEYNSSAKVAVLHGQYSEPSMGFLAPPGDDPFYMVVSDAAEETGVRVEPFSAVLSR